MLAIVPSVLGVGLGTVDFLHEGIFGNDASRTAAENRTQRTTMNPHVREEHTQGGATRRKRRQETQRQRLSLRRCVGAVAAGGASEVRRPQGM